jgi:deoxyribose-phosphate aldolase
MIDREELIEAVTQRVMEELQRRLPEASLDNVQQAVNHGAARIGYSGNGADVPAELAGTIDHTQLMPDTTPADIDQLCDEAIRYSFVAVCINPVWVRRAAQRLRGSKVKVASVVGFPLGACTPEIKAMETRRALRDGAREIDMVINVGALKGGDHQLVQRDIAGVSDACREVGALNKVIIEAAYLSDEEKVIACRLAQAAKAHFVKTSTGFGPGGATVFDVALMRETVGAKMGVKAAGGIRTAEQVREMITAGANRIGASAGVRIVTGNDQESTGGESGESY